MPIVKERFLTPFSAPGDLEVQRQLIQTQLDGLKSAEERNRLGQFATPPGLALDLARYARSLWGDRGESVAFLDPAVGSGSFYSAARRAFPAGALADACGVEVDPAFAAAARGLWQGSGLRVVAGDFTRAAPDRGYNLVLTNPPYVRHHHLSPEEKARLRGLVARGSGPSISGLAGLYAYFLILADSWMADGGLAAWLIPSEFMDVNYGVALKSYLTDTVKLLHVHRFCPTEAQFPDALVTSAVVVFEKAEAAEDHRVRFSFGGPITDPASGEWVELASLRRARKWTGFGRGAEVAVATTATPGGPRLGDFFAIKRGVATGANGFFILERDRAIRRGIPPEFLRPILPGSRHLPASVIEGAPDGYPRLDRPLALLDVDGDLDEATLRRQHPGVWDYLEEGRRRGIPDGYLASHRRPWYAQERRPPAPFLCTYMGRRRGDGNPFRFYWNRSRATASNGLLLLYPKGGLKTALDADPGLYLLVFEHLQATTPRALIDEGRVYGGGLHKMEPKELANLPADPLAKVVDAHPGARRMSLAY